MAIQGGAVNIQGGRGIPIQGGSAKAVQNAAPLDLSMQIRNSQLANAGLSVNRAANPAQLNTVGNASGGGYSGGGGGYSSGPDVNAIRGQAQKARGAALQSGRNAFGDLSTGYSSGLESLLQKIRVGQEGINQSRENNSLNKMRSLNDLRDSVRQGIQSGSVRLANGNALDSSAAEALAKGYGRFGTAQANDINNDYALAERDVATNQRNLDYERDAGLRSLDEYKRQQASNIGNSVYDRLASIQESAMGQGVDAQIGDPGQQRQQIINEALAQLQALDQRLRGGVAAINPLNDAQVQANAYNLAQSGGGGNLANTFSYETAPGVGAVQNGAPIAQLPIVRRPEDQY